MEALSRESLLKLKDTDHHEINLPGMPGFQADLYPYQKAGVAYLYKARTCNLFDACLSLNTLVLSSEGMLEASRIIQGQRISSGVVEEIFHREVSSFVIIRPEGFPPFEVTAEHPVWVEGKGYVPATEVARGDRLSVPLSFDFEIPEVFSSTIMLSLAARYISDGYVMHRSSTGKPMSVCLIFGKRTMKDLPRFIAYAKHVAGIWCRRKMKNQGISLRKQRGEKGEGTTIKLSICSEALAQLFQDTFGCNRNKPQRVYGKRIPGWLLSLPKEGITTFLDEYSDGGLWVIKGNSGRAWSSASEGNIVILRLLNLKLGRRGAVLWSQKPRKGGLSGSKIPIWSLWVSEGGNVAGKRSRTRASGDFAYPVVSSVKIFKEEMRPVVNFRTSSHEIHLPCVTHNCGLGKTVQALGMLQLMKQRGELNKALICTPSELSSKQWARETAKFTTLKPACAIGDKTDRVGVYSGWYDVLFVSYPIVLRDWEYIVDLGYNVIIFDEAAYFRNPTTATFKIACRLAQGRDWQINMTATPVQNNLQDLHTMFCVIGLEGIVGSRSYFWSHHIRHVLIEGHSHTTGRWVRFDKILGYKNVAELQHRIDPYYLRRTISDVEVYLPPLTTTIKYVPMSPDLLKEYKQATGKLLADDISGVTPISRMSVHALQKIIDKAKYTMLMKMLTEDLALDKVVVFAWYLPTIADIDKLLTEAGIKHVVITGETKEDKDALKQRFEKEPDCRVLVGTTAIELSLNLQIGSYMIALDQFYNPTRTVQLIGRIRRIGSQYNKVVFVQLLVSDDTIEARIPDVLSQKAALHDYVFDEKSEIFPALSKEDLRRLIGG